MNQFHKDFYRPDLEGVAVVGDIDVAMVEKMIIEKFSGIKNPENEKARTKYNIDLSGSTDVAIITDPEQPNTVIQIMNKQPKRKDVTLQDRREGMKQRRSILDADQPNGAHEIDRLRRGDANALPTKRPEQLVHEPKNRRRVRH